MLLRSLIFLKVTGKQMIGECKSHCTIVESFLEAMNFQAIDWLTVDKSLGKKLVQVL